MTPEDKACQEIERQLRQCGWVVQTKDEMNILAGLGVAIREFAVEVGEADYLLYVDYKVIGIIEAKPEGHTLKGVESQSRKYLTALSADIPSYGNPLPFHYESTGKITQFTNRLEPEPRSRNVLTFHRPDELLRLVRLDKQLRSALQEMPPLNTKQLWPAQVEAIQNLERSLAENRPRALIQMATGSGKTFTACSFIYRLIKFGGAKRVLFLVDRKNLGRQTLREFQQYTSPNTNYKFTEEYNVQLLGKNSIDPACRVTITTIQRLYSALQGHEQFDEGNEEESMFEADAPSLSGPLPVVYNPSIPIEAFDVIVTDECHRSIYNLWRQVLEYFDAFMIGLTATPSKQTIGFFYNNLVMEYGHTQAVADGVNVSFDIYTIQTQISQNGATLQREPGYFVPRRDRRSRVPRRAELDADLTYTAKQLDRDVVSTPQIRLVIKTFKERLFTEIFPGRTEVPKTLIFAKDDSHADDITEIVREEFGRGDDFCQKITYRTTGRKPEEFLKEFRNTYNPRIVVSVDMIATGTDVKPLECLLFMRNVNSAAYFEQMKGRGSRVIGIDDLKSVTPDAADKERFVIVDAVGVCHSEKAETQPLDKQPHIPLEKLLANVGKGVATFEVVSTLGARLARLDRQLDDQQRDEIAALAGGRKLPELTKALLDAVDNEIQHQRAREKFQLGEDQHPTEEQLNDVERELAFDAVKPFFDPKLRDKLINIRRLNEQIIDEVTPDQLLMAGYDTQAKERAETIVSGFRQFITDNKDELDVIKLFYSQPYRAGLTFKQLQQLATVLKEPPLGTSPETVWAAFKIVEPDAVKGKWGKLVDVIALIRHAIDPSNPIQPFAETVEQRFQRWLADQQAAGKSFTADQQQWLTAIKDHIAASIRIEQDDFDYVPFAQLGGLGKAYELFGGELEAILNELNTRLAA